MEAVYMNVWCEVVEWMCVLCSAVHESFKDYVGVEPLDGENKYDAGEHGLQVSLHTLLLSLSLSLHNISNCG